jgi:hypothetical protein
MSLQLEHIITKKQTGQIPYLIDNFATLMTGTGKLYIGDIM